MAAMSNRVQKLPVRQVVVLSFDGVQILDIAGPSQALTTTNEEVGRTVYAINLVGIGPNSGRTASGFSLSPRRSYSHGPIDTLVVPGGPGIHQLRANARAMKTLRSLAKRARRICGICTGAFGLAEIGLLDGKRAVTHWRSCATLARDYPNIEVDPEPLFVRAGNVWTSAGVTAGIDLTLALIEHDVGSSVALRVARRLVVYMRRSGGQRQYSEPLELQALGSDGYDKVLSAVLSRPGEDWTVRRMAEEAGQTERTFHRSFLTSTGATPGKAVDRIRADLARGLLETTDFKLAQLSYTVGFASESAMRRSLKRHFGVSPQDLRERFRQQI
jgi:transcriptional regulator GlxA family with amidase domain